MLVEQTFELGDTVVLRGIGVVAVFDPKGQRLRFEAGPGRTVRFLAQLLGEWKFRWEDGTAGAFTVSEPAPRSPNTARVVFEEATIMMTSEHSVEA
jgi:hypothetical protein